MGDPFAGHRAWTCRRRSAIARKFNFTEIDSQGRALLGPRISSTSALNRWHPLHPIKRFLETRHEPYTQHGLSRETFRSPSCAAKSVVVSRSFVDRAALEGPAPGGSLIQYTAISMTTHVAPLWRDLRQVSRYAHGRLLDL